jgi:hypothetical protein
MKSGRFLMAQHPELITGFNVIKGFLNLTVSDAFLHRFCCTAIRTHPVQHRRHRSGSLSNTHRPTPISRCT